ncbi:GntR family transcriptional regulator [Rhodanobacter lindaniclasticus]
MNERPPQYLKLKRHILRHINNGDWPPLSKVPSENELVSKFGISRMTVNRAMRELADAGMVTRTQGAGTFVAERKAELRYAASEMKSTRRTWSHDHVASYVRLSYPAGKFRFVGAFNAGDFKTS